MARFPFKARINGREVWIDGPQYVRPRKLTAVEELDAAQRRALALDDARDERIAKRR
jgi:hypothetical protein